ncbi:hypothetical protein N0V93_001151 [Gnomoniopsis smithogilvyi]|uniref:Uncharacterized protein n=1 Tax=Gnomoniopsis smithogilvyi TaxID=1191159 RepID=A0A9W8Z514_9PEZI|nr:hypothetical protein N0V93_001151 [Gnomoniopsis smithogilvyi]
MAEHDDHNGGLIAALRSVYFYYISCSPCRKVGHRRETRKEAEREASLKATLEMNQPNLYRHPNPENTNQYWLEDITMGPSLPKNKVKRGASQATSQRHLQSAGTEPAPSTRTTADAAASTTNRTTTSIGSSTHVPRADTPGSPTIVADELEARTTLSMSVTDSQDLDWNRKRYDREDEELWGNNVYNKAGQRLREVITKGKDTAGRLFDASRTPREREITEEERVNFYTTPRNPPVNDYHPPVVSSRPASKHEYRWMLQPPPPAKVMEGKVPVSRNGSQNSVNSRRTSRTTAASLASKEELGLGRLVGEKIVQDKIRSGQRPNGTDLSINTTRPRSRRTRTASTMSSMPSQRSTRSRSNTTGSESSDTIYERRRRRREAKRKAAEAAAGSEADEDTDDGDSETTERRAGQRPHLPTIASSELGSQKSEASESTMRQSSLAAMSEAARSSSPVKSSGSPLEDLTNRSTTTSAFVTPSQSPDKERSAGSLDSGLAMS